MASKLTVSSFIFIWNAEVGNDLTIVKRNCPSKQQSVYSGARLLTAKLAVCKAGALLAFRNVQRRRSWRVSGSSELYFGSDCLHWLRAFWKALGRPFKTLVDLKPALSSRFTCSAAHSPSNRPPLSTRLPPHSQYLGRLCANPSPLFSNLRRCLSTPPHSPRTSLPAVSPPLSPRPP